MPASEQTTDRIRDFVYRSFPLARQRSLGPDDPLLESGIIDSLGVLLIVEFIEDEFDLLLADEDVVSEAFGSIGAIAAFVEARLSTGATGGA